MAQIPLICAWLTGVDDEDQMARCGIGCRLDWMHQDGRANRRRTYAVVVSVDGRSGCIVCARERGADLGSDGRAGRSREEAA
jgi:hypothetical protein